MELLLLRHGVAVSSNSMPDEDRPLSAEGRQKMELAARGMTKLFDGLSLILCSPLVRTVETAQIVAERFGASKKLTLFPELAIGGSTKLICEELAKHEQLDRVLLVGHEPELVQLHSLITGARHGTILLKKGALACFSITGTKPRLSGYLLYYLWSKQLRMLADSN